MPELPKPTRLSLSAAAKHIARYYGTSALHDNVSTSLHGALCDGSLIASGQYNGKIGDVRAIPSEVWLQFSDSSFRHKALYSDIIRTDINDRFKDDPYYHNPTIATADIDKWLTHIQPPAVKVESPASADNQVKGQLYITVTEAIVWIAKKEWLNYEQLLKNCHQEAIFYRYQFSTTSPLIQRIENSGHFYSIGKEEMLTFAKRRAEGETWTEDEWKKAWNRAATTDAAVIEKCMQAVCEKYNFTIPEFFERLQYSISYEKEQSKKLDAAEQELLDAARDKKLIIRGKKQNGTGDIEDVPPGFLDRLDYKTALWGNRFIPSLDNYHQGVHSTHAQLEEIKIIGWQELRVKREDIIKLWPEHSSQSNSIFSEYRATPQEIVESFAKKRVITYLLMRKYRNEVAGCDRFGNLSFRKIEADKLAQVQNNIEDTRKQLEVMPLKELEASRNEEEKLEQEEKNLFAAYHQKSTATKAFDTLPAPDWREWENISMVPLWKLVALSLNVNPAALEVRGVFDPEFHGGLSDEFKLRLRVTIANQPALGIYTGMMSGYFHPSSYYMPVEVTRFFKWAVDIIGWKLPAGFPKGVSDNSAGTVTAPAPTEEAEGKPESLPVKKKNIRKGKNPDIDYRGTSGPKSKYPDSAFLEMKKLRESGEADSLRSAAEKVRDTHGPFADEMNREAAIERLRQDYPKRIKRIAAAR